MVMGAAGHGARVGARFLLHQKKIRVGDIISLYGFFSPCGGPLFIFSACSPYKNFCERSCL